MRADRRKTRRIGIRCDAGRTLGVGHLVRCVALAEEMLSRGWDVVFFGDDGGLPFAARQLQARGLLRRAVPEDPGQQLRVLNDAGLDGVVLDSYTLPDEVSESLVAAGLPVLAVVDGPLRGQRAHLYVDQNIGAESQHVVLPTGATRLAGTRYALLRDAVRSRRPARPRSPRSASPSVVVAFGGTDAFGLTMTTVEALVAVGRPLAATVVTADAGVRRRIADLEVPTSASLTVREPFDDFPAVLADADLVLGAAGTSAWEYCCLGVPAAVAAVADNQLETYQRLVADGAVLPLGTLRQIRCDRMALPAAVHAALTKKGPRADAARVAHSLVDGDGRVRVVDAFDELLELRH